jgi:hypothetical protein
MLARFRGAYSGVWIVEVQRTLVSTGKVPGSTLSDQTVLVETRLTCE